MPLVQPHDDGDNEEEDNEVEDNDKDDNNNKDNNDDKGILALWLEKELWFSLRYQGYQGYRPHGWRRGGGQQ